MITRATMACTKINIMNDTAQSAPRNATDPTNVVDNLPLIKVSRDCIDFCMELLLLDNIVTTKEEFKDFCYEVCSLRNIVKNVVNLFGECSGHRMNDYEVKMAAWMCVAVTVGFEQALGSLGKNGKEALSVHIFKDYVDIPDRVHLVWSYIEWKHDMATRKFKRGFKSEWDNVFTAEAVCSDKNIFCAVKVGMHALKIDIVAVVNFFNQCLNYFCWGSIL